MIKMEEKWNENKLFKWIKREMKKNMEISLI